MTVLSGGLKQMGPALLCTVLISTKGRDRDCNSYICLLSLTLNFMTTEVMQEGAEESRGARSTEVRVAKNYPTTKSKTRREIYALANEY